MALLKFIILFSGTLPWEENTGGWAFIHHRGNEYVIISSRNFLLDINFNCTILKNCECEDQSKDGDLVNSLKNMDADVAQVPEGLDPNEWLALHSKAFFFSMSRCTKTNTIEMYIYIQIRLMCKDIIQLINKSRYKIDVQRNIPTNVQEYTSLHENTQNVHHPVFNSAPVQSSLYHIIINHPRCYSVVIFLVM